MSSRLSSFPSATARNLLENVHTYLFDKIKELNPNDSIVWEDLLIEIRAVNLYNSNSGTATAEEITQENLKSKVVLTPKPWVPRADNNPSKRYRNTSIEFTYAPILDRDILALAGYTDGMEFEYDLANISQLRTDILNKFNISEDDWNRSNYFHFEEKTISDDEKHIYVTTRAVEDYAGAYMDQYFTFDITNSQYSNNTSMLKLVTSTLHHQGGMEQGIRLVFKRDTIELPPEEDIGPIQGGNLNVSSNDITSGD